MIFKAIITFLFFALPLSLLAQSSSFQIGVVAGEDTEAPSAPTLLSATPIASSQIDLVWSTSTDNVILYGYVLFRDAVPIATTSQTSFSDTGLSDETLYTYSVQAFDGFFNMSSTSNSLATTTLALPVVSVATSSNSQATLVFRLQNFSLVTGVRQAEIAFETSKPARYELRWGRTTSYEMGYVISDVYREIQTTAITDLEPGTKYMYELYSYDSSGRALEVRKSSFTTKSLVDNIVPNVQNLKAVTLSNSDVALSYQIPEGQTGAAVRIVRSYWGYPRDPQDGAVIYDGTAEEYTDTKAFLNGGVEYYAVFLRSRDGTYSSGAVANAFRKPSETVVGQTDDGAVAIEELPDIPWAEFAFDVNSIQLIQGPNLQTFKTTQIELASGKQILIRIEAKSAPDTLKSIIITFRDKSDASFGASFLLRINKDKTAYEAIIESLPIVGLGQITLEIFDYERSLVGRYQKTVLFKKTEVSPEVVFPDKLVGLFAPFVPLLIFGVSLIILLLLLLLWKRRRTEDND